MFSLPRTTKPAYEAYGKSTSRPFVRIDDILSNNYYPGLHIGNSARSNTVGMTGKSSPSAYVSVRPRRRGNAATAPARNPVDHVCRTCQFYLPEPADRRPKLGACIHPKHVASGVPVLIYPQETRCRRGFGVDDWAPARDVRLNRVPSETPNRPYTDVVIDERPSPSGRPRRAFPNFAPIPIYVDRRDAIAD